MQPKILSISDKQYGIAGQFAYTVHLQYPGSMPEFTIFVQLNGQTYIVLESGLQSRIDNPDRWGIPLTPIWIRRFYA